MKYFIGKACTIFTSEINRQFTEEQSLMYFTGIVEAIDETGILVAQIGKPLKSYFLFNKIVGIAEEEVAESEGIPSDEQTPQYMELDKLNDMIDQINQKYS